MQPNNLKVEVKLPIKIEKDGPPTQGHVVYFNFKT